MKAPTFVLCAAVASAAAGLCALAAPTSATIPQDKYSEFVGKLRPLLSISASEEIVKLLKLYQEEAVSYVDNLCGRLAFENNEETEKEFNTLRVCWETAFKSKFVEKVYEFRSMLALDTNRQKERVQLETRYRQLNTNYQKNVAGAKDGALFEQHGAEFKAVAEGFAQVGDFYYAAQAAAAAATCYDADYRKNDANLRTACEWWGKTVEYFDKIELNYTYYQRVKLHWQELVATGFGPAPDPGATPEGGAPAPTDANAPAAPAVTAMTTFQALASIDEFVRPSYFADEVYQIWPEVYLLAKGSTGSFQSLEKGPQFLRTDASKVGLDLERDGTVDRTLGLTGNFTTVDFDIGSGDEKRKWAFVFKTGTQEDNFQGLKTNMQPDDQQVRLLVMNAASMLAQVNGVQVRVIDDNMDGVYGSAPKTFAYPGLSEGRFQPEFDSIVVGEDSKRARPWSQFQEIGGAWYDLATEKGGAQLKATPVQIQTGTLKLDFKGPQPEWLVVHGMGRWENCYFDLVTDGKKPVVVPAGMYEIAAGEIKQGKKQQMMKALILPGPNAQKYTVTAGNETVVKLGEPFRLTFAAETKEESVVVKGRSVTIEGAGFERYERTWNCAPRPEVAWRKAGTKKGSKPERMPVVLDLLEQDEAGKYKYDTSDTWRPLDLTIAVKKGETVEVQLTEKKNKLFGELESAWQ